jgi:hypothetical protein
MRINQFVNLIKNRNKVALLIVPLSIGFIASLAFFLKRPINRPWQTVSFACLPVNHAQPMTSVCIT